MTEQVEDKRSIQVVTSENLLAFQNHQLDLKEPLKETPKEEVKEDPKVEAKEEPKPDVKEEKPEEVVEAEKDEKVKSKLSERMHELAEKAKTERTKREEAEKRIADLEAKLAPKPQVDDFEATKPKKELFTDAFEYAEKLAEWSAKNAIRQKEIQDAKDRQEQLQVEKLSTWNERLEQAKKEVPDFVEKVQNSNISVSEEVKDAIMDSDIGPKILLYLAENPDEATKIGKMTVGKAYIALGKIEATLSLKAEKTEEKKEEVKGKPVEISKAPPPITPLTGASAPLELPVNSKGEWTGTFDQYKKARREGKIK